MASWEFFNRKRRLDIPTWIKNMGIQSYDDFCRVLKDLGVVPPPEAVYLSYVPKPVESPPRVRPASSATPKKSVNTKPIRRKTKKKVVAPETTEKPTDASDV